MNYVNRLISAAYICALVCTKADDDDKSKIKIQDVFKCTPKLT